MILAQEQSRMEKADLSIIVIRLFSIYWIIHAMALSQSAVFMFTYPQTGMEEETFYAQALAYMLVPVVLLIAAITLLIFSRTLGHWITPGDPSAKVATSWTADEAQALAFASVGLLLAGLAVSPLINGLNSIAYVRSRDFPTDPAGPRMLRDAWILLSGGGIQLLLGLGCFLGASGLSRVWRKIRTAGVDASFDNNA
jgi:hypothetical protein